MRVPRLPKFQQIKRRIIADIQTGTLVPGERVASESELMRRHKVARMTVVRSLNDMVAEGYLVRLRGKGTFVRARPPEQLNRSLSVYGLVLPELRGGSYPSLIKSFEEASRHSNRQIVACSTDNRVETQANVILQLMDNRVAGVALLPTTRGVSSGHHVRQLQANRIPVVFIHRSVQGANAPLIAIDFEDIGRMAGDAFVRHGHRRVAFFATHASRVAPMYAAGLRQSLRNAESDLEDELLHYGQRTDEQVNAEHEAGVEKALRRMLSLPKRKRPTGILSTWDPDAELIYLTLSKLGVQIPEEISLVGVGGSWRNGEINRRLTSIVLDEEYAAKKAVNLLDEMVDGYRTLDDNFRTLIPISLYAGQTLRSMP